MFVFSPEFVAILVSERREKEEAKWDLGRSNKKVRSNKTLARLLAPQETNLVFLTDYYRLSRFASIVYFSQEQLFPISS